MMSERLEQLKKQAVNYAEEVFDYHGKDYREIVMEKFAELIVKECIQTLEFHGFDDAIPYLKWMTANKLGVEE